jgi:pimeloyl-ACP methyl ester carboxylesterase
LPEVQLDGTKINYVAEGKGTETIVFVHGLGENLNSWRQQLNYFSKDFKVVAIDLRGHGRSGAGKKKVEIADFANDVIGLLNHLGIKKAHFCGLSLGGLVVFEAYRKDPTHFSCMILVGTRHKFPPAQTSALEGMSMTIIGEEVATFALAANAPESLRREVAKMTADTNKESYIQSAQASSMLDYTDILSKIKVPTLIIVGDKDIVAPVNAAEKMKESISESTLRVMPGVGHLPNRENPEAFNAIVKEFLESIRK